MPDQKNNQSGFFYRILLKIRNIFGLNIGTIIFGVLFIYIFFSSIFYLTSEKIESYQVISGPLSRNETYTGLAIRKDKICQADSNGYITYYAREGSKVNANGAVYGISSTKKPETDTRLSQEDLSGIRSEMLSFSKGFDPSRFHNKYSFKYKIEGSILQYATEVLPELAEDGSVIISPTATLGNQTIRRASADGIVLYSRDGYEGKTISDITAADFNQNSYQETDLKTDGQVKAGQDLYTLITDENWSLLIPLSEKQASKLVNRTSIRVKFLKDDMTQTGSFSIINIDGEKYGRIDFRRGLIRYASDRFLDIELVTNTVSGLKIPLSSIVTKEFYTIPSKYSTVDEESQEVGFMLETRDKDGEKVNVFKNVTIYAKVEQKTSTSGEDENSDPQYLYYIDKSAFDEGDAIISKKDQTKYIVGDIGVLEGVYCINQGYAVFRRIQIQDQNEEYAIVDKTTSYGLALYDHIVRNAKAVKEEDIFY